MPQTFPQLIYPSTLGTIIFHSQVVETFNKSRQTNRKKPEAGGQLFANLKDERIDVLYATSPGKKATRGRYFFRPNRKEEQQEIKTAFQKELHFVGDWHTHPESEPSPSSSDVERASEIFKRSKHELNGLLMVIVGTKRFPGGLWVAWVKAAGLAVIEPDTAIALPGKPNS